MGYRQMSAANAVRQFEDLFRYAGDFKKYECVDNILPKNYVAEVFPHIDPPEDIDIFYEVKADLTEEDMAMLAAKRVVTVQPGIEAMNTGTLKLMKKGTSAFRNVSFLKSCNLYAIMPAWNLLVGFPGEQEDVFIKYLADIPKLLHLPPPGGSFPVRFDRFSPYFMKAEQYGLKLQPYNFYEYVYPFDKESITNLAYYFQNTDYAAAYNKAMIRWLGKLQMAVAEWNSRWSTSTTLFPELYFPDEDNPSLVVDTRSGKHVEHDVGELGGKVLAAMTKPTSATMLTKIIKDMPDFDAASVLTKLQEKNLLFNEGSRFVSLVLPRRGKSVELRERKLRRPVAVA
jgi:ribosomal peptide maturation radical SAM protein 1